MKDSLLWLCISISAWSGAAGLASLGKPSVLVVSMDDVGTDQLRSYDPAAPANTPTLDSLAASGVRYTRAYANPVCSPTRACWITGRYGFRTGIGTAITKQIPRTAAGLSLQEFGLPKYLQQQGWDTWASGKWHLNGDRQVHAHPNALGFKHYRGDLAGAPGLRTGFANYFDWDRTVDGLTKRDTRYITTVTTTDALELMSSATQPWFGYVSFNAAHSPWHDPPYCPPGGVCGNGAQAEAAYPNLVESLDQHLGLIINEAIAETGGNLIIIVWGDNGTPRPVPANAPCPREGKGLLYEGGINVPLLIYVPGTPAGVDSSLVSPTDLYAIVCDELGLPLPPEAEDAQSIGQRDSLLLEFFDTNGLPWTRSQYRRTMVEDRWKLIRRDVPAPPTFPNEQLFDLWTDPCETTDLLLSPLTPAAQAALDRLSDRLDLLGVG